MTPSSDEVNGPLLGGIGRFRDGTFSALLGLAVSHGFDSEVMSRTSLTHAGQMAYSVTPEIEGRTLITSYTISKSFEQ